VALVARWRGGGRHVFYAYLAGLGSWFGWFLPLVAPAREAARRIKATLLRLMHLLPHKAPEHRP